MSLSYKNINNDGVSDGAELNPFMLIDDTLDDEQTVLDTSAVFLEGLSNPAGLAIGSNRAIYYSDGSTLNILENFDRFNRPAENADADHNRILSSGRGTIKDIAVSGSSYVYFVTDDNIIYQYSLSTGGVRETTFNVNMYGTIAGITVDSDGMVYSALNKAGVGKIYKSDFTYQKINNTTVSSGNLPVINDLTIDKNKNIMFTSTDLLYQLTSPSYSFSSVFTLVDAGNDLKYISCDANGGIYYTQTRYQNQTVKYLRPDYTHAYGKNKYIIQTVTEAKITGLDVGSQYDLVIADYANQTLRGFTGSRSDPAKNDSDSDGRLDGYGNINDPYDGELDCDYAFTTNRVGMSSTILYPKPTFPTMADSDSDGCPDGVETTQSYTVTVKTLTGSSTIQSIRSDPSRYDTDSDGLSDGIERNFTDALNRDTDQDGLNDSTEDSNHDGRIYSTETSPVAADSDGDGLADGWKDYGNDGVFGTHDPQEMDSIRQSNEAVGEDFNFSGACDANEPSPLKWDSDGDTLSDGTEVTYLLSIPYDHYHDADQDGTVDVLERDADADGLADNIEDADGDGAYDINTESKAYYYDTDADGLPDGAEPSPFKDLTADTDTDINCNDQNSNDDSGSDDFSHSYVEFRTTATDSNADGLLEYGTETYVATYQAASVDVSNFGGSITSLRKYSYIGTTESLDGATRIQVWFGNDAVNLSTPDNLEVYYKSVSGTDTIFIKYASGSYYKYQYSADATISTSLNVNWENDHHNEVADHQITMDWRRAVSDDIDFDGLANTVDDNDCDRDTDDDGIIDGKDQSHNDPDMDDDALSDGLETGVTQAVPGVGTTIDGTNTSKTFTWSVNEFSANVHNFTADADPLTVTDPKNADTDGDGINDGVEDCDMTNLSTGGHTLKSTDLNGKFDGFSLSETNPLDLDSDDDGLNDGVEDADCDGRWDWTPSSYTGETCSWRYDSDGDNLGDGLEVGKTLWNITLDTNTSIFSPDMNTTTTTNPLNLDTDFDGVPDGWIDGWTNDYANHPDQALGKYNVPDMSFQFGEGEDKNLNGKMDGGETNPELMDSDGDHLADGWDILTSESTNNLFTVDTSGVKRYWGELNFTTHYLGTRGGYPVYQSNSTDPTNRDSDGDGLVDGNVVINGLPCELTISHNGLTQTMFTDPSMQDTDSDGLSDGLEISGWEVHIVKESTKEELKNWTTHSNPTIIDTDSDSVNDYFEFENQSDPLKTDTDGDYILDGDELQGALTQIDGAPPWIAKYDSGTQVKVEVISTYNGILCTSKKLKLTVTVYDPAGIDYVLFKVAGQPDKKITVTGSPKLAEVSASFSYDEWRGLGNGWDVKINVTDRNGNGNETKTHINGFVEGVIKALLEMCKAFVDAVAKLASALFDWIWGMISSMLNKVLQPIHDSALDLIDKIRDLILYVFISSDGDLYSLNTEKIITSVNEIAFHPLIIAILVLITVIQIIEITLSVTTAGLFLILKTSIIPFIKNIVLLAIGKIVESLFKIGQNNNLDAVIMTVFNKQNTNTSGRLTLPQGYQEYQEREWTINKIAQFLACAAFIISLVSIPLLPFCGPEPLSLIHACVGLLICTLGDDIVSELIGLAFTIAGVVIAIFGNIMFSKKFNNAVKDGVANRPDLPIGEIIKRMKNWFLVESLVTKLSLVVALGAMGVAIADVLNMEQKY